MIVPPWSTFDAALLPAFGCRALASSALEHSLVAVAPYNTGLIARGQERTRHPTAKPQTLDVCSRQFVDGKTLHFDSNASAR